MFLVQTKKKDTISFLYHEYAHKYVTHLQLTDILSLINK